MLKVLLTILVILGMIFVIAQDWAFLALVIVLFALLWAVRVLVARAK